MTEAKAKDEGRASAPAEKPAASGGPAATKGGPPGDGAKAKPTSKPPATKIIRFNCQKCRKELRVPVTNAGKEGKCPHCGKMTLAPPVTIIGTKRAPAKKAADRSATPKPPEQKPAKPATRLLPPGMKIPEKKVSLRDTFGVTKVKCSGCGMMQVFQKARTTRFEECHHCGKVITFSGEG